MFSLLNTLDWRDLPVRDPGSPVQVATLAPPAFRNPGGFSYPALMSIERQQTVFSPVIPWSLRGVRNVGVNGETLDESVLAVGGNFFSELGFRPIAGRFIVEDDVRLETLKPAAVHGHRDCAARLHRLLRHCRTSGHHSDHGSQAPRRTNRGVASRLGDPRLLDRGPPEARCHARPGACRAPDALATNPGADDPELVQ
jgi:hypothetical protein